MTELEPGTDEYYAQQFQKMDVSGQALNSLEFEDCTFTKCDFSEATVKRCKFIECSFIDCNLSNLKLPHSKFMDVSFEACKVVGVDWSKADWPSITTFKALTFKKSLISYSSFYGLELPEMVIEECKAHEVDFREGRFNESDFSYSDFNASLFSRTGLTKVNFEEAIHYHIDVLNNDIKGAKFSRLEAVNLLSCLGIELLD